MSNLAFLHIVAGISWEPEIRGALVVLVGGTVLFGSVWLILSTNVGNRLGSLAALAGFFGWMLIMGIIWWIYGIGLKGDTPVWVPEEIVYDYAQSTTSGDVRALANVELASAPDLIEEFCPGLVAATVEAQRARVVNNDPNIEVSFSNDKPYCNESIGEKLAVDEVTIAEQLTNVNEGLIADAKARGIEDSRIKTPEELAASIEQAIRDAQTKVHQLTLSDLAAVSSDIIDDAEKAGQLDFRGWTLLSSGEAGEAIATADAAFLEQKIFDNSGQFVVLDTFQRGGKPERASDGMWDRVANEIRNTVLFWNPKNTTVVTVTPTLPKETLAGQAPPFAEIDPNARPVSMVMVRDLGDLRLPSAIVTISALVAFLGLCLMLHRRDVALETRLEEWDPTAAS